MSQLTEIISEKRINSILYEAESPSEKKINHIIDRSLQLEGLSPEEAAVLLQTQSEEMTEKLLQAARLIKEKIYGKRLVLFAPLYFDNLCENSCLYCSFRKENEALERKRLSIQEIKDEVRTLQNKGHKRLLVLTGEKDNENLDYLIQGIQAAYEVKTPGGGEIRRINVEIAPLSEADFRQLADSRIGTYTCFQETYHKPTYEKMHPAGPKSDFEWRLNVMDRAQVAGIDDVGIGALFGLYDYRFEVLALLLHAQHLDQTYGVGPHTVSVPRLQSAAGAPLNQPPCPVSDEDFKKLVAVLRLAIPYTGIILSTREPVKLRNQLFQHGVSQISAGSCTTPGGYEDNADSESTASQFSLHDTRPMSEIIAQVSRDNYLPSFCTACYRVGRTGEDFMDLAKPGEISHLCKPNAMLTFKEYLSEYADDELKQIGSRCLEHHLQQLEQDSPRMADRVRQSMRKIEQGKRDIYL